MSEIPLVDDELLIFTLLKRDVDPTITVAGELDIDSIDHLPLVTFGIRGGDQTGNGPGLWLLPLTFRVFAEGHDMAWEVCSALFGIVHDWALPGASLIEGLGYVSSVNDISKFSRDTTVDMQGKNVTQYSGSFELIVRNN